MTLRTREMRRSALVKVPSFSRKDEPGRKTWAYLAVSFRNRSCTTMHSIAASAAVLRVRVGLHDVLALAVQPLNVPPSAASNILGMRRPGSGWMVTPQSRSNSARAASSEMWR